jgi:hypothetical protein
MVFRSSAMYRLAPVVLPLLESLAALLLCIPPGWIVARRVTTDRLTRLLLSPLLSYFLFYQIELASYAFHLPPEVASPLCLAVSVACAAFVLWGSERRRDLVSSFHLQGMSLWVAVVSFALGLQASLVVCGVGSWGNDWHEHYYRSLLFAEHWPPTTTFSAMQWTVPARGPLFNATCAVFLGLFGREFWTYQAIATVLNTTGLLAIGMALRDFAGVRERSALLMSAAMYSIAPFAVTEIAYPWTKFLTLAYILCGLRFLLVGLESDRPLRPLLWSSLSFALGILTHYYVAIPAAICALYYLASRRRAALRPAAAAATLGALIIAPWVLYSVLTFGFAGTFGANSTVRSAGSSEPSYPTVVAANLLSSTFPTSVRHVFPDLAPSGVPFLLSADSSGRWRARAEEQDPLTVWMIDLVNGNFSILGTLGLAGILTILAAALTWDRRRQARPPAPPPPSPPLPGPTALWTALLVAGILLTVMAYPRYADNGLRGAGLHLYILLMPLLAIRELRGAPRALLASLVILFLVESAIVSGAFLALQAREVPMRLTAAGLVGVPGAALDLLYIKNYALKRASGLVFLSDYLGRGQLLFSLLTTVLAVATFTFVAASTSASEAESATK